MTAKLECYKFVTLFSITENAAGLVNEKEIKSQQISVDKGRGDVEYQNDPESVGVDETDLDKEAVECLQDTNAATLTRRQAEVLVDLLSSSDNEMVEKALVTISNAAAFTCNQELLREVGCLSRLSHLLSVHAMALQVGPGGTPYPDLVDRVIKSINNLALNTNNQTRLQESIPALIDFASSAENPDSIKLSSLQALTNLSISPANHAPYTQVVQSLYEQLDKGAGPLRMQALKLLVNLSCNPEMVPHLLAAKAPACVLELLQPNGSEDYLLRWLTVLANIMSTTRDSHIKSGDLPTDYKAASPETMHASLYGLNHSAKLKSKVFVLSKHDNEEVRHQALRLYACFNP